METPGDYDPLAGLVLPMAPLLDLTVDQLGPLRQAVDILTAKCMSDSGLEYIPYPEPPPESLIDVRQRFGYISPMTVSEFGYLTPESGEQTAFEAAVNAVDAKRDLQGAIYNATLYDGPESFGNVAPVNSTGCYPLAQREVYGIAGGLYSLPQFQEILKVQIESSARLYSSGPAVDVTEAWSSCMAGLGYDFSGWPDARQSAGQSDKDTTNQASSDLRCRFETGLELALFETEADIQLELLDENAELVRQFDAEVDEMVQRAINIVAAG